MLKYKRSLAFTLALFTSLLIVNYHYLRDNVSWYVQKELCLAAADGDIDRMEWLVSIGAWPNGFNTSFHPITFAAQAGQTDAVRFLLDKGVDINSPGKWLNTPLSDAAANGHLRTVKFLLDRGANPHPTMRQAVSALCGAAEEGHTEIVELLLAKGAGRDGDEVKALRGAVTRHQTEVVRLLLAHGVEVNNKDYYPSVLTDAIEKGNPEIIKLLRQAGAKE